MLLDKGTKVMITKNRTEMHGGEMRFEMQLQTGIHKQANFDYVMLVGPEVLK